MICNYKIIGTGSKGNAVIVGNILIDCGVPYRDLKDDVGNIALVLLTHTHGDHFNATTIHKIAKERPMLRWACGEWMAARLVMAGVNISRIDVLKMNTEYDYKAFTVAPVPLHHDVPNCGWKIYFPDPDCKVFYATDTENLDGIEAKGYDMYFVESNFDDDEIRERISEKKVNGEYAYEYRVLKSHLSKAKCDDFICRNATSNSQFIYMHQHHAKESKPNEN